MLRCFAGERNTNTTRTITTTKMTTTTMMIMMDMTKVTKCLVNKPIVALFCAILKITIGSYSTPKVTKDKAKAKPKAKAKAKAKANAANGSKSQKASAKAKESSANPPKAPTTKCTGNTTKPTEAKAVAAKSKEKASNQADAAAAARRKAALEKLVKNTDANAKAQLGLVVAGHVDAGKSTLMGHVLFLLKYVTKNTLRKYEQASKEIGKGTFSFAWVLDEQEEERERGVTVDVGVKYFETTDRKITLLDAPGHRDFIPNMISGAAQADAALLVVPASASEFESSFQWNGQTREHALLLRYLGLSQLVVVVNKMDSCDWSQDRYNEVKAVMKEFLVKQAGFQPSSLRFIPVSGLCGENLLEMKEEKLKAWYSGATLIDTINGLAPSARPLDKAFRLCISDVRKGLTVGGRVEAGFVHVKDKLAICPEGETCVVKSIIQDGNTSANVARAGENVDLVLSSVEPAMLHIGSILCPLDARTPVTKSFTGKIVTLDALQIPILRGSTFTMYMQSCQVPVTVTNLISSIPLTAAKGTQVTTGPRFIAKNQTAVITVECSRPICVERYEDYRPLARFLLRGSTLTVAAGIVQEIH